MMSGEPHRTSWTSRPIWFCFLVAFPLLFAWHLYHGIVGDHWTRPPLAHGDGPDYESLAFSLSRGDGFQFAWQSDEWQRPYLEDPDAAAYSQLQRVDWPGPTASRPPGFPFLISVIYRIIPRGPTAFAGVRFVSILCTAMAGGLAVCVAFELARTTIRFPWGPTIAALVAFLLAVLDRTIRTYSVDFLTEPYALFLCTVLWICGLKWLRSSAGTKWLALMAIATAAMTLTRSIAIFWLPWLTILVATTAPKNGFRWGAIYLMLVLLMLSPWWLRNVWVMQSMMPLGGQGAASLRGGYCDEALADYGNWHGSAEERIQQRLSELPGSNDWTQAQREVALAREANQETWSWIQSNNRSIPELMWMRVVSHWSPFRGTSLAWKLAILAGWIGILAVRRREAFWILGLPVISTLTVAVLYETGGRFLVPLYSLLYMTAGLGVAMVSDCIWGWWVASRRSQRL